MATEIGFLWWFGIYFGDCFEGWGGDWWYLFGSVEGGGILQRL